MAAYRIVISPRARRDISEIHRYTVQRWGEQQAEAYVDGIWAAIESLATFPELGLVAGVGPSGTRRIVATRHVIYYRIGSSSIEIARIVHDRRDAPAALG
jgi:toxin ParE1/3/4